MSGLKSDKDKFEDGPAHISDEDVSVTYSITETKPGFTSCSSSLSKSNDDISSNVYHLRGLLLHSHVVHDNTKLLEKK